MMNLIAICPFAHAMSKKMHGTGNYFIFWVIGGVPKLLKKYTKKIERGRKRKWT